MYTSFAIYTESLNSNASHLYRGNSMILSVLDVAISALSAWFALHALRETFNLSVKTVDAAGSSRSV